VKFSPYAKGRRKQVSIIPSEFSDDLVAAAMAEVA
jgi:hypothetical protein